MSVQLSPIIHNLMPGLTELGKIKIGRKGHMITSKKGNQFQPPEKLDHFIVTTLERDNTGNYVRDDRIHRVIGDKPTRIPILLMFDDITLNFQSRYVCFKGKSSWCTGDGEQANRQNVKTPVPCPCERAAFDYEGNEKCKMNGVLSVIIRGADSVGGAWKFRTTSVNSIQGIYSSLMLLSRITGGILSGLDLDLVLAPKTATAPNGQVQTIYVVGIEFSGGTMQELREASLKLLTANSQYRRQMERLESEATKHLTAGVPEGEETDYIEEFAPEQVEGYVAPKPAAPAAPIAPPVLNFDAPLDPTMTAPVAEPVTEPDEPVEQMAMAGVYGGADDTDDTSGDIF